MSGFGGEDGEFTATQMYGVEVEMFLEYALTATAHLNKCHCLPAPLLVLPIGVRASVPAKFLPSKLNPLSLPTP